MKSDFPLRFINGVFYEFQDVKDYGDESFIIPLLDLPKPLYPLKYPTVNLMKLNQNILWRNFTNSLTLVNSEFQ